MLIAVIAILHVVINHGMAVGGIPLVCYLERRGLADPRWDRVAWRLLKIFFVVTTTAGAMTGVGIWLSAGLVNPIAIGSLLRVFFWTWFMEWLVFVTEVALILAYYFTWKRWTGQRKARHVRLGLVLSIASWVTMALIVSILSFMMDVGAWSSDRTLLSGMFNPIYLPQLAFRTPLAMIMAGAFGLAGLRWIAPRREDPELTTEVTRALGRWVLAWMPLCIAGGVWYASVVPSAMAANLPVALLTQALARWADSARWILLGVGVAITAIVGWAALRPRSLPRPMTVLPAILVVLLLGTFERVREFIRKPYAIPGYLYSNGYRVDDYPLLQRDGLLARATYTTTRTITSENQVAAGREVFMLACTRCHTVDGVNSVRTALRAMYGDTPWITGDIDAFLGTMHNVRPYMPPFPGSPKERTALAAYLVSLQATSEPLDGAQATGTRTYRPPTKEATP